MIWIFRRRVATPPQGATWIFRREQRHSPRRGRGLRGISMSQPRRRRDSSPRKFHVAAAAAPRPVTGSVRAAKKRIWSQLTIRRTRRPRKICVASTAPPRDYRPREPRPRISTDASTRSSPCTSARRLAIVRVGVTAAAPVAHGRSASRPRRRRENLVRESRRMLALVPRVRRVLGRAAEVGLSTGLQTDKDSEPRVLKTRSPLDSQQTTAARERSPAPSSRVDAPKRALSTSPTRGNVVEER